MKIKFDEKNKAVIAEGYYHHKKIRAVSVCSEDDTYDKDFGSKLALSKYKYKETLFKIKLHESIIKNANAEIARLMAIIENEENIINNLDLKANIISSDTNKIIESKYNTK